MKDEIFYLGRPLSELTREELIDALKDALREIEAGRNALVDRDALEERVPKIAVIPTARTRTKSRPIS